MPKADPKAAAPADLATKKPANDQALNALRAEVAPEPAAAPETFAVPIGDTVVQVKHYLDWPSSADEFLIAGRMTRWAEKILADGEFNNVWVPAEPTNRHVLAFVAALEDVTGIPFVTQAGSPTI